jgi:hypothetical protein
MEALLTFRNAPQAIHYSPTLWIVVNLIGVHFVFGTGWLFYKILGAKPTEQPESEEKDGQV